MKHSMITAALAIALLGSLLACPASAATRIAPIFINHNCTNLAAIPLEAIAHAQDSCKWHYVRLSHGRQLMVGLSRIEDADPFYAAIWPDQGGSLPNVPNTLCIYTAAKSSDGYWSGSGLDITRNTLTSTPELNISAFSWCTELNTATASTVANYLAAMQTLENEFPNVTFVYFTGTAQYDGGYGYNRYLRNDEIRRFCLANNKVLYDFEDLDSWWQNPETGEWEQATYEYDGCTVPVEHPMLAGDDAEHTSYESCEQKGRATWWMMAVLSGWTVTAAIGDEGDDGSAAPALPTDGFELSCYPNPFNPSTTISFSTAEPGDAKLAIFDARGALVKTLIDGPLNSGEHRVRWNGTNEVGDRVASGVYFYRVTADKRSSTKKMILLR